MPEENSAEALGGLIFEILRTAAALDAAGAALVAPIGLTPARWQVLATATVAGDETVAGLARRLSQTRQSVQRVVNDLVAEGHLTMVENPSDRRALLVRVTATGQALVQRAELLRRPWTATLATGMSALSCREAIAVLGDLRHRLTHADQRDAHHSA